MGHGNLECCEFLKIVFQAWKLIEFKYGSWKVMEIIECDTFENDSRKKTSLYDYIYLILEALYFFRLSVTSVMENQDLSY